MILSDALTYSLRYQPKAIIDLATLTGACVVALGDFVMGTTIIIFLLTSFEAKEETVQAKAVKPTFVSTGTQALRVVRCHSCPIRGICREANVKASYRLESPLKARSGEDYYAEMLRVTMNCPAPSLEEVAPLELNVMVFSSVMGVAIRFPVRKS
jgi:hypothetical protein